MMKVFALDNRFWQLQTINVHLSPKLATRSTSK